jgi:pteridine reductase
MNTKPLALVTGGMRRLGASIALKLTHAGYDLALASHVDGGLESELSGGLADSGGDWHGFVSDLSDPANAPKLIEQVRSHFGRTPNVLVNNSAMFGQDQWPEMSPETLEDHFRLNLFSPLLLSTALVSASGADKRPAIVHILDQRIQNPHCDQLSYTLSKQALAASVRSLAVGFGSRARVNGVAPGLVISTEDYDAALEERLADMMPLGALPTPSGVADAVHYLAEAKDVTGQIIFVDGGANLKSFDRDFMHL